MSIKFKDFIYVRPDIEKCKEEFNALFTEFNEAESASDQIAIIGKINVKRNHFSTMNKIASIRYSGDTENTFYDNEKKYFDKNLPLYSSIIHKYYEILINSKFLVELEGHYGKHLFNIAKLNLKTFNDEIIDDLRKENELVSEYIKLCASAKIEFDGEVRNLTGMSYFMESSDREVRKEASAARWKFYEDNEKEFDRIYDELVKLRSGMAKKLGYKDFIDMAYERHKRTGYNRDDVKNFRESVKEFMVPVAEEIKDAQKKRLGYDDLQYYDLNFIFKSGNAFPKGSPEWIEEKAKIMYSELSPETKEFFDFMSDHGLMDLDNRNGKQGGGYCSFIPDYKSPFIFSNMNGTTHDVTVLTHEAGHAFQAFESRNFEVPEYTSPTLEACEIHSMSMEFITWPWMSLFFEEDTAKFLFTHLTGRVMFIPYGVTVDEFQHRVYENPEMTPEERKKVWREIELKYTPYKHFEDNDFLERGGWWMHQKHIFAAPFYYIDYCLAQVCAFQFWEKCNKDKSKAWEDYLRLCKAGGSKPFLELVELAGLKSPFESETVKYITGYCENFVRDMGKDFSS
ncbi:MAG TPA: M3 family oligoendopeptidase [Ignavibacteria bacterium]|nr:M3 family oligoendopeptidase [Ignavibacteria bacterium]HMR41132.1 M3 family oligoendopeptidase [Ignavibacteria bacterium]